MTSRLTTAFAKPHPALVTAGDRPSADIIDALVAGGADVIDPGMPFTDPMADGPAIQAANLCGRWDKDMFTVAEALGERV